MNQCAFKHSARNLPLNDSMKALSVGLPGREKSSVGPRWNASVAQVDRPRMRQSRRRVDCRSATTKNDNQEKMLANRATRADHDLAIGRHFKL
jgi:hypothetical protein